MNKENIPTALQAIDNAIKNNSTIKSILLEKDIKNVEELTTQVHEARKSLQEFLDAPLGDKKEIVMKKAYAAAIMVAQDKGLYGLPVNMPQSGSEVAAIVDEGLTRVKVNYLVGKGVIRGQDAINEVIDRAESRAIGFVDKIFESGKVSETITNSIEKASYTIPEIGPIVGPLVSCTKPIIKTTIARFEEPAKKFIRTGIQKVAKVARDIINKACARTIKTVVKIKTKELISALF